MRSPDLHVRSLARGLVGTLCALALLFGGCSGDANRANRANSTNSSNSANQPNKPSCLPPGYQARAAAVGEKTLPAELPGEELDVKLAVVEGRVITRRRLVREAGPRAPGQSEADYERSLHRRLKDKARLLIWAREAQRVGVTLAPQQVDNIVADTLKARIREVEETTGRRVTVREYLAEKNKTPEEFRAQAKEELYYQAVMVRLLQGIGPEGRPQVDMTVTPAEVRRVYWSHPGAFDEKKGVRFVVFQIPVERYLVDDVGFLEAEEKAQADAETLAAGFRRGSEPPALATQFELSEGEWLDSGQFVEREGLEQRIGEDPAEWLFDPQRKTGDATIFQEAPGPLVVGIRELRTPKRIPYEEAYDKISNMYRYVRQKRLEEERLIQILTMRNVVQPDSLQNELLMDAQVTLEQLARDPILGAARFR